MEKHSNPSSSPAPTMYVQAEEHTFRDLVQRLTGSVPAGGSPIPSPSRPAIAPRRHSFKLQDRRGPSVRKIEIQLGIVSLRSPRASSPSISSPVTPLASYPLFSPARDAEERAIAEKGFYLHPSPRGGAPSELLPLFPLSSPAQSRCDAEIETDQS